MPLKTPFTKSSAKPAAKSSAKGKVVVPRTAQPAAKKPQAKPVARRGAAPAPVPPPPLFNLSPERKLDVLGIGLALGGALLFLALISVTHDMPIGFILDALAYLFGWAVYILPVALFLFGIWLVFRKIERIPAVSV